MLLGGCGSVGQKQERYLWIYSSRQESLFFTIQWGNL